MYCESVEVEWKYCLVTNLDLAVASCQLGLKKIVLLRT